MSSQHGVATLPADRRIMKSAKEEDVTIFRAIMALVSCQMAAISVPKSANRGVFSASFNLSS